jgi:fanconi-associated nuclease 1
MWIDVLLQANISVEVCHVHEEGQDVPKRKLAKSSTQKKRKRSELEEEAYESEEVDYSQLDRTQENLSRLEIQKEVVHKHEEVSVIGSPVKKSRHYVDPE